MSLYELRRQAWKYDFGLGTISSMLTMLFQLLHFVVIFMPPQMQDAR